MALAIYHVSITLTNEGGEIPGVTTYEHARIGVLAANKTEAAGIVTAKRVKPDGYKAGRVTKIERITSSYDADHWIPGETTLRYE